ncbi:DNA-3-methyladenine glycosylase [Cellulomonas sp. P24]|uniref:DNA-3-methyladenine glycosylase n=1 Tax=Cellulomonas sp. P24 TaxID=2885206 RepID=UPI00216AB93E|nr:DNA-3-methyladenine glycosylase [Cellulomonas sp. P24]MCR6491224.1 DNA-3-methyladenine glycosylase [Cellulomonas sp. P24]
MSGGSPSAGWFERDVTVVAQDLLGATLTTRTPDGTVTVRISEVEAYGGAGDPGSHAYRGLTRRNAVMFDEPGRLYVYRHLGLHHCVNIVVGPRGTAAAVLIRAGQVVDGEALASTRRRASGVVRVDADLARGPARLAVALGVDLAWNGLDVVDDDAVGLRVPAAGDAGCEPGVRGVLDPGPGGACDRVVASGPRVGVSGAGGDARLYPWRFWLVGDRTVSAYRAAAPRRSTFGPTSGSRHNGATPVPKEKL